jgi:formyl-CoA transferase
VTIPSAGAGPLAGLRVVDLCREPDALTTSVFLADLGADVVLVEPCAGHAARRVGPFVGTVSLLWKATARNKRVIAFDESHDALARLERMIGRADVLIVDHDTPFAPANDETLEQLAARFPSLVVVSVRAFGLGGPDAPRGGYGRAAEAFGGQCFAAGEPDRPPLHSGLPIGAAAMSLFGALGAVAAVLERDANGSGLGQVVDVAGFEAVLRVMEFLPIFFQQTGFRNERSGSGSSYQVPVATWRTADDKSVTFTGNTNDVVHRLYHAMGRPELVDDERFATNDARVAHRVEVEKTLADWARSLDRADLEKVCDAHKVPVGSVFAMDDIFGDENYLARGSIATVADGDLATARVPCVVPRLSRTPGSVRHLGYEVAVSAFDVDAEWPARPAMNDGAAATAEGRGPLHGLRVLDIGQILAGPFAATLFADLGADVVKVEKPAGGDDFRRQAPFHEGLSLWWKASARNKRSIALDLKDPLDRERFRELVARADVVIANFVPGALERLGLDYDTLRAQNPALVMVCVSGYGQDGPYRTRRAFGRNAEAYGGLASVTGYVDGPPMPTGFPVADALSATLGAFGAMCALYARRRDPEHAGQLVDVALYETVFRCLELPALVYDQLGIVASRSSYGTTAGETICVAASRDGDWFSASRWDKGPAQFGEDDPYGGPDRARAVDEIRRHIEASTSAALRDDPAHAGFTIEVVQSIDALFDDRHAIARRSIEVIDDAELGSIALAAVVPRFARTPGRLRVGSPRLDAHRTEILQDWIGATSE